MSINSLENIQGLENGWDEEGSIAPTIFAVEMATRIVESSIELDLPLAFITPLTNGGVGLSWGTRHTNRLLIEVKPDGTISDNGAIATRMFARSSYRKVTLTSIDEVMELLKRIQPT